jgi:CRP-like cAMP-binding protein
MVEPGSIATGFARETLRQCPLFRHVGGATLDLVASSLRSRRHRKNEVIFHQGDPGDSLYIIESGAVKIVLPSREGDEAIIATLHRGDFFGELALLDGAAHSATATAVEPVQLLVLSRDPFLRLVDTERDLRTALLASLAGELRRLTRHVEELHFLDLAGRLAARLARLAREAYPNGGADVRLDWPYTQSDLAAMIGGTRQSVNRLLSDLVDEGLVRLDQDTIVIPDVARLERSAER